MNRHVFVKNEFFTLNSVLSFIYLFIYFNFFSFVFQENDSLKKENQNLKTELSDAQTKITSLDSQLDTVRQQSIKFMLEQMERLHTCRETDV